MRSRGFGAAEAYHRPERADIGTGRRRFRDIAASPTREVWAYGPTSKKPRHHTDMTSPESVAELGPCQLPGQFGSRHVLRAYAHWPLTSKLSKPGSRLTKSS